MTTTANNIIYIFLYKTIIISQFTYILLYIKTKPIRGIMEMEEMQKNGFVAITTENNTPAAKKGNLYAEIQTGDWIEFWVEYEQETEK